MRKPVAFVSTLALLASACSGGGSGSVTSNPGGGGTSVTPTPTASPTSTACALRTRQDWAAAQMDEWYLFPETLPAASARNPAAYSTVGDYVDSLTATARAQSKDRYFTYMTSIAEENAYYSSGSSAGFGVRLGMTSGGRLYIIESYEGAPALNAGIDRGAEIVAVGTTAANLQTVASLGSTGTSDALGPSTAGTTRVLRITDAAGTRNVTLTKADFTLPPVSSRYGAKVIDDGGRKVGYINLRTFITTANSALQTAFANFRAQGITNIIVDLRYNGGGLVSTAELMSDLLGGGRSTSDVQAYTTFRASKSSNNETSYFAPTAQSVTPAKIAFIGGPGTASASEYVMNAFIPYLHANAALIGTNTYGKPVGQIARDNAACDDRLRVIAFALENAAHQGAYYTGLANTMEATCRAVDDISYPMGDPNEASTRAALDFLAGRSCTRIASEGQGTLALRTASTDRELLMPNRPTTVQREAPGTF